MLALLSDWLGDIESVARVVGGTPVPPGEGYDDAQWRALAQIRLYEYTKDEKFLKHGESSRCLEPSLFKITDGSANAAAKQCHG